MNREGAAFAKNSLFNRCIAASLALHAGLFLALKLSRLRAGASALPLSVEIDLSRPFLPGGPARLAAPKRLVPQAPPGPALPAEEQVKPEAIQVPQAPKQWVTPGPETKKIEKQPEAPVTPGGTAEGSGTAAKPGGYGEGANEGVPGGTGIGGSPLLRLPQLLNRDEVLANLRRFYPEIERRAGREGTVVVNIHIGTAGMVERVDIAQSARVAFDNAAKAVAFLMRFSPAEGPRGPVPVKISQTMVFRLQD